MAEPTLEDRMIAAHKLGMVTFKAFGGLPLELLSRMLAETGLFDTMAENMAFLAGYQGAQRRAAGTNQDNHQHNGSVH
jgi:hypothetical protein